MFGNLFGGAKAEARKHFARANALTAAGKLADAAKALREAIRIHPDFAAAYCNLGLLLDETGELDEALRMLRRAVELEPANAAMRTNLRIISAKRVPMWHFSMMNDTERNDAYERAVKAAVRPDSLVLEIGTGSGLVAMMAARAGARRVVTCEMVAPIADTARRIIQRNGYSDRVTVVSGKSTELRIPEDLPEPADVLVSEIISADLIGEGLIEAYEDARRLLKPDAAFIPSRAWVRGQLVAAADLDRFVSVGRVAGFELSDFNQFMPVKVHPSEAPVTFEALTDPFDIFDFDLQRSERFPEERRHFEPRVARAGRCVGLMQWVKLQLATEVVYENAPQSARRAAGHWQPVVHVFDPPVELKAGDAAPIVAIHNRYNLIFRFGRA